MKAMTRCMATVLLMWGLGLSWGAVPQRSDDDWQLLYDQLRQRIDQHSETYPSGGEQLKASCYPYVEALNVFAKDRDEAFKAAQEAQASSDPKVKEYFGMFLDLVEQAEGFGNGTLLVADILLRVEDNFGPIVYDTLTLRADRYGKCLYDNARELQFDHTITRGQVQHMLEKALDDLEKGWTMKYGWLYPEGEGGPPEPHVDEMLEHTNRIRELAPYFELEEERRHADGLMNRYLKDSLCILQDKSHKEYLEIGEKYQLAEAREYIEGFYGTLKGRVWKDDGIERKPAEGARVVVVDPIDGTKWEAVADDEGNYKIKDALLHEHTGNDGKPRCPKFRITAEYGSFSVEDTYEGPLHEPDKSAEYEKNLVIPIADLILQITASAQWDQKSRSNRYTGISKAIIEGTMKLDHKTAVRNTEVYEVDRMTCRYEMEHRTLALKPSRGCPAIEIEFQGSGQPRAVTTRSNNYLRVTYDQKSVDSAFIRLHLHCEPVKTEGKQQKSHYHPGCTVYENFPYSPQLSPSVFLETKSSVASDGTLVGNFSRGLFPGEMNVCGFDFNMPGGSGQAGTMNIEWRIIRRKPPKR